MALLEPLRRLWGLSDDVTFARAFIEENGLYRLMNLATSIEGATKYASIISMGKNPPLLMLGRLTRGFHEAES